MDQEVKFLGTKIWMYVIIAIITIISISMITLILFMWIMAMIELF